MQAQSWRYRLKEGESTVYRLTSRQEVEVAGQRTLVELRLLMRRKVRSVQGERGQLLLTFDDARGSASIDGQPAPHVGRLIPSLRRASLSFTVDARGELVETLGWQGVPPPLLQVAENLRHALELMRPRWPETGRPAAWQAALSLPSPKRRGVDVKRTAEARYRIVEGAAGEGLTVSLEVEPRFTAVSGARQLEMSGRGRGQGQVRFEGQPGEPLRAMLDVSYDLRLSRGERTLAQKVRIQVELERKPEKKN